MVQVEGMFDLAPSTESRCEWDADLPLDERPWSIGLIVGPSGCGKSTLARELFPGRVVEGYDWPSDRSLLDGFPEAAGTREVVELLSSVGFSSPPEWLRPYRVLSTGQQFRVTIARALVEIRDIAVIDEFTSVIDRQVAQIGSAAIASAVRRSGRRLVAVTCHYDVEDWLQPDWRFTPADGEFRWRSLQPRPAVSVEAFRVHHQAWRLFHRHHYLTADLNPSAACWLATLDGRPAVFVALLAGHAPGRDYWRISRVVCLPDYQGIGLGGAVLDADSALYAASTPVRIHTSHPGFIRRLARSRQWHMARKPSQLRTSPWGPAQSARGWDSGRRTSSVDRRTASFLFCGPPDPRGVAAGAIGGAR